MTSMPKMVDADHHAELMCIAGALDAPVDVLVYHYIRAVLDECGGNVSEAARRLGMHRRTYQRMLLKSKPKRAIVNY